MKNWLMIASIVAGVATAGLTIVAASIPIRNEIDSFMNDIYWQGWRTFWAAVAAVAGVVLQAAHYFWPR